MKLIKSNKIVITIIVIAIILSIAVGVPLASHFWQDYSTLAKEFLDTHVLIDGHNDLPYMLRQNLNNRFGNLELNDMKKINHSLKVTNYVTHTDFRRIRQGRLGAQFFVAFAFCNSLAKDATRIHLEQIDLIKRVVKKYSTKTEFVASSDGK